VVSEYRFKLTPPNTSIATGSIPRTPFPSGYDFVLEFEDTILGDVYFHRADKQAQSVVLQKNGVNVGSFVTIGAFTASGVNLLQTPGNSIFQTAALAPRRIHGIQVSESNSGGVVVATRLRQFLELGAAIAPYQNIHGVVFFTNNSGAPLPRLTHVADFHPTGVNFNWTCG
jgi:hypothetical protein